MDTAHLADRLVASALGLIDVVTISIGHQLGLYRVLHDRGPLAPDQLAELAGIAPRYAREWLEQQSVAGILEHRDGTFALPAEHAPVLVDAGDLTYLAPLADLMTAAAAQTEAITTAFRTGGGVPWSVYGPLMRTAQAAGNRPWFLGPLTAEWLPSVAGLSDRLDGGGRVLEVGCGEGWASIAVATRWPSAHVDALDIDDASIQAARNHAAEAGVSDRVTFHTDPATLPEGVRYDLAMALECVHDVSDPVPLLGEMRARTAEDGVVLVMDERTTDAFTGSGDEIEQLLYGWSVLICLPDSMSHPGSVATGTVMRPETLRGYATAAGFSDVEVLPIEHDLWRFYQLLR
ncbi:class I SAM-dependent methyltransferase [Pseudactinotalea suaedae]|uniref:class I SAM-dependent methyltransferase n=1 Tax=Pseudactinotalea suaedae TaxID=1524924 RepID=UPI0012E1D562|nr:class I SAM-dependent methyltransferase [Pseudactinotalea suaedae]